MILISHKGNLCGKDHHNENKPSHILNILKLGFHVEIDVWYVKNEFYLGHDEPIHKVSPTFLINSMIWCHAKNIDAILEMQRYNIHYFWHESDTITLTSKKYIWAFPGKQPIKNSIAVLPELYNDDISSSVGICSDNIYYYKQKLS